MKKVNPIYREESILVNEVKKGISIYECNDIVIPDNNIEKISSLLEKYNNDDEINSEISFADFLEDNEINWKYISDGYYTEKEFTEKYEGDTLINMAVDEVLDAQNYYDWYEEVYFYEYWDGHNWQTLDLEDEGEDVVFITEVERKNTYEIDLYYNVEGKETFKVYNSYYEGSLLIVDNDMEIEDESKEVIEDIENLLEKINYKVEHNNKCSDKFEGFKISITADEKEMETFEYISNLYDWFEKDDKEIHISKKY
ncbi:MULTISPECIES: hypothetical protein [Clostridia]|uniref:hypothetical protein n=1 Tax=Clostridia TaxID=186801 RepID=UPI002A8E4292|nr:hypothetical protein [Peptostreptococcus porci]MDY5098759.1 hypothetical protein [Clostridium sp.]MDY5437424.1 hypothetical protein [Peptostreptococcus porci]